MSQNPLSVNESGSKSFLFGKSTQSADSKEESESGGFLSALKSVFSSESESTESVKKATAEEVEEGSKSASVKGEGEAEAEAGDTAKVVAGTAGATEGEESVDQLLSAEEEAVSESTGTKNAKKQNVDQAMTEGNQLLGRLDEANKTLQTKSAEVKPNQDPSLDNEGNPLPQAAAGAVVASQLSEGEVSEQAISEAKAKYLQSSTNEMTPAQGVSAGATSALITESDIPGDGEAVASNDSGNQVVLLAGGAIAASQSVNASQTPIPSEIDTSKMNAQELAEVEAALASAGAVGAGAAMMASQDGSSDIKHATHAPKDAQIDWSQGNLQNTTVDQETQLATTFKDGQATPLKGTEAAAVGAGVSATQAVNGTGFEGQPLTAAEQADVQFAEPMWATSSSEMGKAELQAVKGTSEAATSAKMASSAALTAHLTNPTTAPLPADKMAAAAATQVMPQELTAAAMNQQVAAQTMTAGSATQASNAAAASAASSAAIFGATKLAKGNEQPGGEKSDFSQQLAGVAATQGLTGAQAKADAQAAASVQQSPLQLSRDGSAAGDQLAERVQMMMSKNLKNVDIRLDPPELGRMQIRMTMNNDIASVQFTVANQQTRDIVEQAMPRLREMLSQQGLQLADTSVQQQNAGQQQQSQYVAGQGSGKGNGDGGLSGESGSEGDESLEVNVDVKPNRDGISFYA
ncbi:putative Flagellar hook-length control protein fliK [Vibrio nigripulchritudo MADA3029]|uniref:flagellar hook-length control protein FliK n=1 Tax=Vibrio nigripulchritudo TaxID=28173 RepID=UPI0003B1BFC0|nr:flagellar hook-length control protein FliK [Vibrio nigripulchritudo]CCN48753.1 putative Flagellar hook-length control protein fliK [Vibrio nigripulchritudo MADA3020]CCN52816.1 putative Flagellar hook-length control protein fliK [Vibrio nigripulchritudo MADA3021]CCN57693.1 putative Flagellar hook-length control protein fliK [Vibrio nigripulchritudo MADA3029]